MPLDGTLKDLSLPNLVQLQCGERKRAQVRLTRNNLEGILVFADGDLVHASLGPLDGEDAVYELLTWEEGDFRVTDGVFELAPRNVNAPWQTLVLEGLRRADEIQTERAQIASKVAQETKTLAGISGWHLCTIYGQEINAAGESIANPIADWTADALQAGTRLGQLLKMGAPREMVFSGSKQRGILVPRDRYWLAALTNSASALAALRDALSRSLRG